MDALDDHQDNAEHTKPNDGELVSPYPSVEKSGESSIGMSGADVDTDAFLSLTDATTTINRDPAKFYSTINDGEDSSDEEFTDNDEQDSIEASEIIYQPLDDDFTEFQEAPATTTLSGENHGNLEGHMPSADDVDDVEIKEERGTEEAVSLSIPPLSSDKILTIKNVMARIQLKPPPAMTAALMDSIDPSRLRLGDEI